MSSKLDTRVIQVTNAAPATQKEQLKTLFGFLGRVRDCKIFPPDGSDQQVVAKVCYIEFEDSTSAGVALHLNNTVFIDRALIVVPVMDGKIPDEKIAMQLTPQTVARMTPGQPAWPANVVSQLTGTGSNQTITTYDPRLNALGLPQYPPLSASLDTARVEEIRRTVYIGNLDPKTNADSLISFFSQVGEIKYVRMAGDENGPSRSAYMEFTDQRSVATCLTYNGVMFNGRSITVSHSKTNISKPLTKSQEASRREIEEAMKKVKEAQGLISAAAGEKSRSRSRSRRRSRSRSRGYSRSRSRSRRRSRSRSRGRRRRSRSRGRRSRSPRRPRRSRSRSPRRRRSRSRSGIVVIPAKERPSRSRRSRSRSPRRRSRSRSPRRRSRTPPRAYSSRRSRSRSKGRKSRSRSRHRSRSRSRGKDKSKDKSRDKDRGKDKEDKDGEKKKDREEKRKGSASSRSPSPPTLEREGSAGPHSGEDGSPVKLDSSHVEKDTVVKSEPVTSKSGGEPQLRKGRSEDSPDKKPSKKRDRSKSPVRSSHRRSPSRSPVRPSRRRSPSRSPVRHTRRRSVSPVKKRRSKSRSPRRSRSPKRKKARSRSRSGSRHKSKKDKKKERSRSRERKDRDKKKKSSKDKKEEREKPGRVTRDYDEEEKGYNSGSDHERAPQRNGEDDNDDRRSSVDRQQDDMDTSD